MSETAPDTTTLDHDVFDAIAELISMMLRRAETLAGEFGVPGFCLKAMHRLGEPMPLRELGKRLHCDPSFVTSIADALEERGLARREPNPADRRVKNLVLTERGQEMKARLEKAIQGEMPWSRSLEVPERECLLTLVRKMVAGSGEPAGPHS